MAVQKWLRGEGPRHQAVAGAPIAEAVIGVDDSVGVGVVEVMVPAGAVMAEHAHGDSASLLIPQEGRLKLIETKGGKVTEIEPGVLATIPAGERVKVENPEAADARMLVVLAPASFADAVAAWPVVA